VDPDVFSATSKSAAAAMWMARLTGSLFVAGHIAEAKRLINAFEDGQNVVPAIV
jgi:hypothetical protein